MPSDREIELSMHRCCFAFSRYELLKLSYAAARDRLDAALRRAVDRGYVTFLCGMNRGADLWAAQTVLRMKSIYLDKDIKLVSVLPFPGYGESYTPEWKEQFDFLMEWGQAVYTVSEENRGLESMYVRNRWMVDRCTRLIGLSTNDDALALDTFRYAKAKELDIDYI